MALAQPLSSDGSHTLCTPVAGPRTYGKPLGNCELRLLARALLSPPRTGGYDHAPADQHIRPQRRDAVEAAR